MCKVKRPTIIQDQVLHLALKDIWLRFFLFTVETIYCLLVSLYIFAHITIFLYEYLK